MPFRKNRPFEKSESERQRAEEKNKEVQRKIDEVQRELEEIQARDTELRHTTGADAASRLPDSDHWLKYGTLTLTLTLTPTPATPERMRS